MGGGGPLIRPGGGTYGQTGMNTSPTPFTPSTTAPQTFSQPGATTPSAPSSSYQPMGSKGAQGTAPAQPSPTPASPYMDNFSQAPVSPPAAPPAAPGTLINQLAPTTAMPPPPAAPAAQPTAPDQVAATDPSRQVYFMPYPMSRRDYRHMGREGLGGMPPWFGGGRYGDRFGRHGRFGRDDRGGGYPMTMYGMNVPESAFSNGLGPFMQQFDPSQYEVTPYSFNMPYGNSFSDMFRRRRD